VCVDAENQPSQCYSAAYMGLELSWLNGDTNDVQTELFCENYGGLSAGCSPTVTFDNVQGNPITIPITRHDPKWDTTFSAVESTQLFPARYVIFTFKPIVQLFAQADGWSLNTGESLTSIPRKGWWRLSRSTLCYGGCCRFEIFGEWSSGEPGACTEWP
jgi:hypothetical protein